MIEAFLKAKHWQLFAVMFGIPMILQFTIMGMVVSNIIVNQGQPDIELMFNYYKFIPVVMIISYSFYFGWFWSIVMGFKDKLPEEEKLNILTFKILFFIPLIYTAFLSVFMFYSFNENVFLNFMPNVETVLLFVAIFVPIHFFSIFCIYYTMYVVAKTYKAVELQRKVRFSDYIGEYAMLWFYPVGIWLLQPKINKMIEND